MTPEYWVWIFVGALFAAKLIVTAARLYPAAPFQRGVQFMTSPSGTAPFPYTPAVSLLIWGLLSIGIWLVFVAPSLYSGDTGRATFLSAVGPNTRERTPLIVSMTAFGTDRPGYKAERRDYYACDDRWSGIDADDHETNDKLARLPALRFQDAVFASGSPFPIYPAAKVQVQQLPGLFVDGGYAHRVPIEAASLVRAAQILVIENVVHKEAGVVERDNQRLGTLTTNLASAFNFLFDRSQIADLQRGRKALVGAIYPDWSGPDPFLMDFRDSVVRRLKDEALEDLRGHRVARVESWGEPNPNGGRLQ
jgi:hypothetical protein